MALPRTAQEQESPLLRRAHDSELKPGESKRQVAGKQDRQVRHRPGRKPGLCEVQAGEKTTLPSSWARLPAEADPRHRKMISTESHAYFVRNSSVPITD